MMPEGGFWRASPAEGRRDGAPAPPTETAAFTRRWFTNRVFLSERNRRL